MRDSLNLHQLRQFIEAEQSRKKRNQTYFSSYIVTIIVGILILNQILPFTDNSFVFSIGILLLIFGFMVKTNADNIPLYYRGHKILAGFLPDNQIRRPDNRSVRSSIEFTLGIVSIILILLFWRTFTTSTPFAIFGSTLVICIAGVAGSSTYRFWAHWKTLSTTEKQETRNNQFQFWLFWIVFIFSAIVTGWLKLSIWLSFALFIGLFSLLTSIGRTILVQVICLMWVQRGVNKGNYETGLKRLQFLKRWFGSSQGLLWYEGQLLFYGGFYEKAFTFWKDLLPEVQNQWASLMSSTLAFINIIARRIGDYQEAFEAIETSIEIKPELGSLYFQLADTYLDMGENTERALQLTKFALDLQLPPQTLTMAWGIHARALAANGYFNEADGWIQKVQDKVRKTASSRAYMLYHVGRVQQYKGNLDEAVKQYKDAIKTDPDGDAAFIANQALEKIKSH